jgi:hypothetical protein
VASLLPIFIPLSGHANTTNPCSRTFPDDEQSETVRDGYEPDKHSPLQPHGDEQNHNLDHPFRVGDGEDDFDGDAQPWEERNYKGEDGQGDEGGDKGDEGGKHKKGPSYGSFREEREIWGDSRDS